MGARDLLADLAAAGVTVTVSGAGLAVQPASRLTADWRAALVAMKAEVLALLCPPVDDQTPDHLARLQCWGWPEAEARTAVDRLAQRDADDDRVSCIDCLHYRPGHCGNHQRAGLKAPGICRDWAGLLQRCGGYVERAS